MRQKLERVSGFLSLFSILLVAASFFSIPFPFVRLIWIQEVWGISGLFHALIFFVLSRRILKVSVAAPLAGIGLVLNEEIRAVLSYGYLRSHFTPQPLQTYFLAGSILLGIFLIWMLFDIFKAVLEHKINYFQVLSEKSLAEKEVLPPISLGALWVTAAGYFILSLGLSAGFFLNGAALYGVHKTLSSLTALYSFSGAGQEINFYLEGRQSLYLCTVKILSHLLVLSAFLWVIYRKLPVVSVLITG